MDEVLRLMAGPDPLPGRLRFEKLKGRRRPSIHTIHVTGNHAYEISFEIEGEDAVLRRVGTHKLIDRRP